MPRMYEVKRCKIIDSYTDTVVGWGYFMVDLFPRNGRLRLEEFDHPNTSISVQPPIDSIDGKAPDHHKASQ